MVRSALGRRRARVAARDGPADAGRRPWLAGTLRNLAQLATVQGLDRLSIGELAAHIGMSKSGLYAHFGSKVDLLNAGESYIADVPTGDLAPHVASGRLSASRDPSVLRKADAVIAFSGLDPRANDSGMKTGRRRLSKRGPSEMRRLFYNAAMSAARTATWNPTYQRARAAGKTTTEALVILARKLLRVAFALYKTKTEFDANKIGPASAV